ncbi:MAG: prepilin-type N-terminal cleavage/methylation domain-containing protein [Candidatus Omnitrophica bacterium]|nr:prepilin-type N-terminal cleavage/methylation domain-containing protein [Candidatus Omnitrophota bacterium]
MDPQVNTKFKTGSGDFTLIELLIVIAIILILIAIALPNFTDALLRARVSQARGNLRAVSTAMYQHTLDWGSLHADYNDSRELTLYYRMRSEVRPVCSPQPDREFNTDGGLTFIVPRRNFYSSGVQCPLTTPIEYLPPNKVLDPFGDGTVPLGYDSREMSVRGKTQIVYGASWSAGPDRIAGDWLRWNSKIDVNRDGCNEALPYSPTNGSRSRGELWIIVGDWGYPPVSYGCGNGKVEYLLREW